MTDDLSTAYKPVAIEQRWYDWWEKQGLFHATPNDERKPFTIVIPPPNVTGALHMGHALNNSLQDMFVRRARMQGFETLWLPGTDHAGIATQNVMERELARQGTSRQEIGRDAFVERVWAWKEKYGDRIIQQLRRLGCSCDWERERFTMDEGLSRAVRTVFVRWFDDGLIYRGLRIINWCPFHTTALSDAEVEHEDVAGELVTFRYPLEGGGSIPVSTTRVETMLGDTAIAVHPDDDRYDDLIGRRVEHPFFPDRDVRVIADDAVDIEFGTGAVKVTPAHDPLDFEIGERHGLDKLNILDESGRTNENAGRFAGLDRYEARGAVLAALQELGLVDEVERPYVHPVGHCYRCHTEIEPWLSEQWFVKMAPLARPAIDVVTNGRTKIAPARFEKAYLDWMNNLRDWCISRQLWWGHRIPVWYCDACGEVFAALEDPTSCPKCGSSSLRQDPDVLDTWFSSQLWPFSTLGWPDETPELEYFYPTTLMVTAYEILYLWVSRMIMSGLYCMGDVPFREVFIHGIVRDFEGKKMSKSLGNVIDPIDMIDRYGADALRFSLGFIAVPGNDSNVSEDRIEGARNFANKLWNAARFVLMSLKDARPELPPVDRLDAEDRWILSRLDATISTVEWHLESYNWAEALRSLHRFTWSEYCDWYIELAKRKLDGDRAEPTRAVLLFVLDHIVRLLHPVMPFITEELWSRIRPDAGTIMGAPWPEPFGRSDLDSEVLMDLVQEVVSSLRRVKADHSIPQSRRVGAVIVESPAVAPLKSLGDAVASLARLESLDFVPELPSNGYARTVTDSGIEAAVSLMGAVDVDAERKRLSKKLADSEADIRQAETKLANPNFTSKAPAEVVDKERTRLADARVARDKVQTQLDALDR